MKEPNSYEVFSLTDRAFITWNSFPAYLRAESDDKMFGVLLKIDFLNILEMYFW